MTWAPNFKECLICLFHRPVNVWSQISKSRPQYEHGGERNPPQTRQRLGWWEEREGRWEVGDQSHSNMLLAHPDCCHCCARQCVKMWSVACTVESGRIRIALTANHITDHQSKKSPIFISPAKFAAWINSLTKLPLIQVVIVSLSALLICLDFNLSPVPCVVIAIEFVEQMTHDITTFFLWVCLYVSFVVNILKHSIKNALCHDMLHTGHRTIGQGAFNMNVKHLCWKACCLYQFLVMNHRRKPGCSISPLCLGSGLLNKADL